jgi:hypothetical protein
MSSKIAFKNTFSEKRWLELHKQKTELLSKKSTLTIEKKLNVISSLMTSCKVGFNLTEAKVKKIIKELSAKTGMSKIRYATIPQSESDKTEIVLFKDIVVSYVIINDEVLFREKTQK